MVFTSLSTNRDSGYISQFSSFVIIAFSYFLNKWKKIGLLIIATISLLFSTKMAFGFGAVPGACGTMCMSQQNYYGTPIGGYPVYPYSGIYPNYMSNNNWQFSNSPYQSMWYGNCVECNMMNSQNMNQSYNPSWYNYGTQNYNNFNYPGSWNQNGLNGHHYTGNGQFAAGKPNIYFSGKDGTSINLKIKFDKSSNLLAALPIHGSEGWNFELTKNSSITTDGANYSYLFYDYRVGMNSLQSEKGFCVKPNELMPRLESILYQLQFEQKEVADFNQYWSVKIPKSEEYCVYPQIEKEMAKSAKYQITPTPSKVTRINFVILTKEIIGKAILGKFSKRPQSIWDLPARREVASSKTEKLEVREWGVSFWVTPRI